MASGCDNEPPLPSAGQLCLAVELYLRHAYPQGPPESLNRLRPSGDIDVRQWLMGPATERTPPDAPPAVVRSFALRLGNAGYPNMKLRLSRPPRDDCFIFVVDSHDAFLHAAPGSRDYDELEQLKRNNARIAAAIVAAWEAADLPTEPNYLRLKIQQVRDRTPGTDPG